MREREGVSKAKRREEVNRRKEIEAGDRTHS